MPQIEVFNEGIEAEISEEETVVIDEPVLTQQEKKKLKKKAYKQRKKEKVKEEQLSEEVEELQKQGKENLEKWENMCNMIDDYKKKFNRFPNMRGNGREVNDEAAKVLARWLWLQNVSFNKGVMNPYHVRRLEEIGFNFKDNKK